VSVLASHVEDYLRLRRALGFKLRFPGQVLPSLAACLEAAGAAAVTAELAVAWAGQPQGVHPVVWSHRLGAARGFARYLKTIDPAAEIPPAGIWPTVAPRRQPVIFADGDITRLIQAARTLNPPLRAATFEAMLGLIAATEKRAAAGRGHRPRPGRRRPAGRAAHHPQHQVRPGPPGPAAPDRGQRAGRLRPAARPAVPGGGYHPVLRLRRRHAGRRQSRRPGIRAAHRRAGPARRGPPAQDPRPAALGGRLGYVPCRGVSAAGGGGARLLVRIMLRRVLASAKSHLVHFRY